VSPGGRPEIGPPINIRLGDDLLALVDDYAAHNSQTRAQAIRFLLTAALSERHGSAPSGQTR
jgi:metal-responsive CopG/Arc/MetJ family transcriptional regulator